MSLKFQKNPLFQVGLVCLFWLTSDLVVHFVKFPLPGGILGLGVVLLLLMTKRIRLDSIKRGTELLLGDMLLFFIPAVLAILEHHEFLSILGSVHYCIKHALGDVGYCACCGLLLSLEFGIC